MARADRVGASRASRGSDRARDGGRPWALRAVRIPPRRSGADDGAAGELIGRGALSTDTAGPSVGRVGDNQGRDRRLLSLFASPASSGSVRRWLLLPRRSLVAGAHRGVRRLERSRRAQRDWRLRPSAARWRRNPGLSDAALRLRRSASSGARSGCRAVYGALHPPLRGRGRRVHAVGAAGRTARPAGLAGP